MLRFFQTSFALGRGGFLPFQSGRNGRRLLPLSSRGEGVCLRCLSLSELFNQKDKSIKTQNDPKPVLANDLVLSEDELMDLTVEERLVESGFHLFRGRYEKALPTYDFIIDHGFTGEDDGVAFRTYFSRAECLKGLTRYDEAMEDYLNSITYKPDVMAVCGIADCLRELGRFDSALKRYNDALKVSPKLIPALGGRAEMYLLQGKKENALEDYTKIIKEEPGNVLGLLGIGDAYLHKGDMDRALYWYVQSIEKGGGVLHKEDNSMELPPLPMDTKDQDLEQLRLMNSRIAVPEAWHGIAVTLIMKRKFETALSAIDRAISLSQKLPLRKQLSFREKRMTILLYLDRYNEVLEECAYIDQHDEDYLFISSTLFHKAHAQFYLAEISGALRTAQDYLEIVGWHEWEAENPDKENLLADPKSIHDVLFLTGVGHLHECFHDGEFSKLVDGVGRGQWPFNGVLNLSEKEMKQHYSLPCEVSEDDLKRLKEISSNFSPQVSESFQKSVKFALSALSMYPMADGANALLACFLLLSQSKPTNL